MAACDAVDGVAIVEFLRSPHRKISEVVAAFEPARGSGPHLGHGEVVSAALVRRRFVGAREALFRE
jgi:hypothetical protein